MPTISLMLWRLILTVKAIGLWMLWVTFGLTGRRLITASMLLLGLILRLVGLSRAFKLSILPPPIRAKGIMLFILTVRLKRLVMLLTLICCRREHMFCLLLRSLRL